MLAYDYPLMSMFLSFLYFFLMILWIWIAIMVVIDVFRSHDMGGWTKALWLLLVFVLPYLGVFIYLIARGGKMAEHRQKDVEQAQSEFQQAVKEAGGVDTAGQLEKLAALKERGVLSDEEFAAQKAKLLA
jgi:phosphoribosylformimino-5-aminoimidazole carboxamide ribonucleotide (ProFAR) isomerase